MRLENKKDEAAEERESEKGSQSKDSKQGESEQEPEREREMPGVSNNNLYKHTLIIHIPFQCWRENPKFTEHN